MLHHAADAARQRPQRAVHLVPLPTFGSTTIATTAMTGMLMGLWIADRCLVSVSAVSNCFIADGSITNNAKCTCGTVECDASITGLYCNARLNHCSTFASCAITNGTSPNSANCACGTTTCDQTTTGLYCQVSTESCSKIAGAHVSTYAVVTSGKCTDQAGYSWINDAATCEAAASQVGWSDTLAASITSSTGMPRGCFDIASSATGGNLFFNSDGNSPVSCAGQFSKACLCSFAAPQCPHDDGVTTNEAPCVCGTTGACTTATGLICDITTGNDRCSAVPTCTATDGTVVNDESCACGTVDCDAATTGLFCNSFLSRCSETVSCRITDGTVANDENCACGTSDCDGTTTGLYCHNPTGSCSKIAGPHVSTYAVVTSGKCTEKAGYSWINDAATCEAAASQVGWSDTLAASITSSTGMPRGCFDIASSATGGNLFFNSDGNSPVSCAGQFSKACLCSFAAPQCPHDDGVTTNEAPCVCGTTGACTTATGLICDITTGNDRCSAVPTCTATDGTVVNDESCACGTVDCDAATTGLFCNSFLSRCSETVSCRITDGTVANDENCACGTSDCDGTTTGLFCNDRASICNKSAVPVCTHTRGLVHINESSCVCGTEYCAVSASGFFCTHIGYLGECTKNARFVPANKSVLLEAWDQYTTTSYANGHVGLWNTSRVLDMGSLFYEANTFNQDISLWDVSRVESMSAMFSKAYSFNQDLSKWDVSRVVSMLQMFNSARSFNQDLSKWDVSRVESMLSMFAFAYSFNQDLSKWDVSRVNSMQAMFRYARSFNQDLSKWDVSKVTGVEMNLMFFSAISFNQDISLWNVDSSVVRTASKFTCIERLDEITTCEIPISQQWRECVSRCTFLTI